MEGNLSTKSHWHALNVPFIQTIHCQSLPGLYSEGNDFAHPLPFLILFYPLAYVLTDDMSVFSHCLTLNSSLRMSLQVSSS